MENPKNLGEKQVKLKPRVSVYLLPEINSLLSMRTFGDLVNMAPVYLGFDS